MKSATWARQKTQKSIDANRKVQISYLKSRIKDSILVASIDGKNQTEVWVDEETEGVAKAFAEEHGYTCTFRSTAISRIMTISW